MKNKFIAIAVSNVIVYTFLTSISANAANSSQIVDNDPIAPGCSYAYSSNMYYNSASGSYNNDMRISSTLSSSNSATVTYNYPVISVTYPTYLRLSVYLNHSSFTDENSRYTYEFYNSSFAQAGFINQNTAAGGWNDLYVYSISAPFQGSTIKGHSSKNYNQKFGSDAVKMTVYY